MKASRRNKEEQNAARETAKRLHINYSQALDIVRARKKIKEGVPVAHNVTADDKHQIAEGEPRVIRSPLVEPGEYFPLNSWDSADGQTRLLLSMDASDEEFKAAEEALAESDKALATMEKVTTYVESFESDKDVIERCRQVMTGEEPFTMVEFRDNQGNMSMAYLNDNGEGARTDNDIPVVVKFIEEFGEWRQVDPWQWSWDGLPGEWTRVTADASA